MGRKCGKNLLPRAGKYAILSGAWVSMRFEMALRLERRVNGKSGNSPNAAKNGPAGAFGAGGSGGGWGCLFSALFDCLLSQFTLAIAEGKALT